MRFVPHSHNKSEGLSMVFAYSCASRLRQPDLRFSIRNEISFVNEISNKNENIIGMKTGTNPFQNELINLWGKTLSGYHVNKGKEINEDGMN